MRQTERERERERHVLWWNKFECLYELCQAVIGLILYMYVYTRIDVSIRTCIVLIFCSSKSRPTYYYISVHCIEFCTKYHEHYLYGAFLKDGLCMLWHILKEWKVRLLLFFIIPRCAHASSVRTFTTWRFCFIWTQPKNKTAVRVDFYKIWSISIARYSHVF